MHLCLFLAGRNYFLGYLIDLLVLSLFWYWQGLRILLCIITLVVICFFNGLHILDLNIDLSLISLSYCWDLVDSLYGIDFHCFVNRYFFTWLALPLVRLDLLLVFSVGRLWPFVDLFLLSFGLRIFNDLVIIGLEDGLEICVRLQLHWLWCLLRSCGSDLRRCACLFWSWRNSRSNSILFFSWGWDNLHLLRLLLFLLNRWDVFLISVG